MPSWLEVSLIVNGEMAEAVADVLARHAPGGVVIESTAITHEWAYDPGAPSGPLRVCAYLEVNDAIEDTRARLEQGLGYLNMIAPLPAPQYRRIEDQNWMEAWKERYRPIAVGKRLLILPAWADVTDPARLPIRIDPGMAFGTGTHPTTQLSLIHLERYAQPGQPLLDIGCGSGILSIGAHRLGAAPILGVDISDASIENARLNTMLNGITGGIEYEIGSVAEVKAGRFSLTAAPVVVANILAHVLLFLLETGLGSLVSPGGVLLLSGILQEREAEMHEMLTRHDLTLEDRQQMEDWVALAARRS
ncbi:MAG: 50S ribosomal protein L11 methyltransferase [Anaerolineae bacterium]|nr:MAG: 50S ribosomal protein L11 methyltransferase [Anaerolineae bacterium]